MFVVKEPILTEKSFSKIKDRVYLFKVERGATKNRIKSEIEFIFNVKVARVNTLSDPLRRRRVGRFSGFRSRFKRAVIFLEEGYSISIYPEDTSSKVEVEESKEASLKPEAAKELSGSEFVEVKEVKSEEAEVEPKVEEPKVELKEESKE